MMPLSWRSLYNWGLTSIVSGLMGASVVVLEKREAYHLAAGKTLDWVLKHAWDGSYFYAILEKNGAAVKPSEQMVRSDAWVFNA